MSDDRLAAALADRYRIERELGQGGMATVYLAHDVRHGRKVALKVLRPELAAVIGAERFLVEIKTTANLQHPHILPLHDSGEADGTVFYVMPYVEGESLRDRLTREHQLSVDEAIRIAREVADALGYAHGHGIIHRDIKPENILLHGGHALVADFGIALAISKSDGGTRMTETGMSLGTPHYMSPEQAMGEREITAKSDVYALGCVLYEMLAGEPPFSGPTAQAVIARVLTEEPRSLILQRRTIPPHVEAAVLKALAKLPADRFATAAQFDDALASPGFAATAGLIGTAATAGTVPRPAGSPARRTAVTVALAATTVVALAVAAWGWLRVRAAERRPPTWQYITLGDSVTVSLDYPAMALSPDGGTLVFKDRRQNSLLWIKQRGQLDPTPIPGTERAQNPVFSPDGEWIAFVADQHLKKVRRSGGTPVTIADSVANGYGGAAWLDDGTLVYVTRTLVTLKRVAAGGGSGTVVLSARLDSTLGGGGIGHPVALPHARGVLFQVCSSGCVTMSIHVLDLPTGSQKPLLDDVAQAWYLPNGRLFYVRRNGEAAAAPFDLDRLEITGDAARVLEDVQVQLGQGFALLDWSPSGSLVYVRGAANSTDVGVVRVSRDGLIAPIDTAWYGRFNSLSVSPDGRRLAVGVGAGGGLNIWIKQLDHGPFTRLTFSNQDRRPAWSPDGKLVAFVRDSAGASSVYARPADGSGPDRPLAHLDRMVQEVTWSPDGGWLVLRTDNTMAGAGDLVGVRTLGDATPVPLVASRFTELHPAVSPDGRWLAYTSNESGTNEVYVRPFPNTNGGHWQVSNGGGTEPVWAPSGRELFYLNRDSRLIAGEVQATATTFAVGRLTPLFDASGFEVDAFHQAYGVTPNGGSFVFVSPAGGTATGTAPRIVWVDHWFSDLDARLKQ
jgi:Tol biopolymer transport system component/tRNA A-37 threonylcarbamoyl transferase component Bud32